MCFTAASPSPDNLIMETSPDFQPFLPPAFPATPSPSLQNFTPDHPQPSLSPPVSSAPVPIAPQDASLLSSDTDMLITQLPSAVSPPSVILTHRPAIVICPACNLYVTTHVMRVLSADYICKCEASVIIYRAVQLILLVLCWILSIFFVLGCFLQFVFCPRYRHTCPNCRGLIGYGIRG